MRQIVKKILARIVKKKIKTICKGLYVAVRENTMNKKWSTIEM